MPFFSPGSSGEWAYTKTVRVHAVARTRNERA